MSLFLPCTLIKLRLACHFFVIDDIFDLLLSRPTATWNLFVKQTNMYYTFHDSLLLPRYPLNAFSPHGHFTGLQIGAKADTD